MTDDLDIAAPEDAAPGAPAARSSTAERNALVLFVIVEVVALAIYLFDGRHIWFFQDEWAFLAGRGLNVHDLFRQYNGHLVALPIVIYRTLFAVVGLRTYLPYQLLSITGHLVAAALLRAVIRRAGVGPWIATAAASLFVLFGTGVEDIVWAFQITFVGALVFGFTQLLLADHDGPIDRRDWIGLAAGSLALMCSAVGIAMVAVVGVAALIRRGWRAAAFHALPIAIGYGIWESRNKQTTPVIPARQWRTLLTWDRRSLGGAFSGLTKVPFLGWVLLAVLVGGLVVAWLQWEPAERRRRASLPFATLFGAVLFVTITGARGFWFPQGATSSRYMHITAALLLPAIAVAADALWRRSRVFAPIVIVLLVIGIPGNLAAASRPYPPARYTASYRQMMTSLPRMPLAHEVPGWVHPEPNQAPLVTISWLLGAARSGKLPAPRKSTPVESATNRLRLSLQQRPGSAGACRPLSTPTTFVLERGERVSVRGTVTVQLAGPGAPSTPLTYGATLLTGSGEHLLIAVTGPLELTVRANPFLPTPAALCGEPKPADGRAVPTS